MSTRRRQPTQIAGIKRRLPELYSPTGGAGDTIIDTPTPRRSATPKSASTKKASNVVEQIDDSPVEIKDVSCGTSTSTDDDNSKADIWADETDERAEETASTARNNEETVAVTLKRVQKLLETIQPKVINIHGRVNRRDLYPVLEEEFWNTLDGVSTIQCTLDRYELRVLWMMAECFRRGDETAVPLPFQWQVQTFPEPTGVNHCAGCSGEANSSMYVCAKCTRGVNAVHHILRSLSLRRTDKARSEEALADIIERLQTLQSSDKRIRVARV